MSLKKASFGIMAVAPSAPDLIAGSDTGTLNTDNITKLATPTFTGTGADAGATVRLYDTDGVTLVGAAVADGLGNWSIKSKALAEGAHTLTVKQTNISGDVSDASAGLAVVIDKSAAAPGVPDLIAGSDTGAVNTDNITKLVTPTFTGAGAEAGATVRLYDTDGVTLVGAAVADGLGNWSIKSKALAEGAHTLTVKQIDIAGNVSAASASLAVTIDKSVAAPGAPDLIAGSDTGALDTDNLTNLATPTFTGGGAEAGANVRLYDTDGVTWLGAAVADALGMWSIKSKTLAEGTHSLTVKQTDLAGNRSVASASLAVTIDRTGPAGLVITAFTASSFSGVGEVGSVVTLSDGSTTIGWATVDAAGAWTMAVVLPTGSYDLSAKATDEAGNIGRASRRVGAEIGTSAQDVLTGSDDRDLIIGGDGDDTLNGQGRADVLDGGAGRDYVSYIDSPSGLTVDLAFPLENTLEAKGDVFISIENIAGSNFDDVLFGDTGPNELRGHLGADSLDGDEGFDYASYSEATTGVTVDLDSPELNTGEAAGDTFNRIEGIIGSSFDDVLVGTKGGNVLRGGPGADILNGWLGVDWVSYRGATSGVTASLSTPAINTGDAAGDTYFLLKTSRGLSSTTCSSVTRAGIFSAPKRGLTLLTAAADSTLPVTSTRQAR